MDLEYVNCNLCGENNTEVLFFSHDRWFKVDQKKFQICKCRNCGLVYVNPRPTKEGIARYYPPEYGPHQFGGRKGDRLERILSYIWYFRFRLFRKKSLSPLEKLPSGRILDVGCGSGHFLKKMKDRGWDIYGVDISSHAIKQAKKRGLENLFVGELSDVQFPGEYFDVVYMKYLLEHVHEPLQLLKEVNRVLTSNGLLLGSVPNIDSWEAEIFGKYWFPYEIPRHLYHFTPHTLELLCEKAGFKISKIEYTPRPADTVRSIDYLVGNRKTRVLKPALAVPIYSIIILDSHGKGGVMSFQAIKSGETLNDVF